MKPTTCNMELFVVLFSPHILLILILLDLYPHTGLGRILSIPLILILNFLLAFVGCYLVNSARNQYKTVIIISILTTTLLITLVLYPQDGESHIITLIIEDIIIKYK